jgi:hypothetical protein
MARHLELRGASRRALLEMAWTDADEPNWASLAGASLSARGEQLLMALAALASCTAT